MPRKAITGRFRPASSSDFKTYAKHLSWLTGLPVQTAQTVLATIYGYGSRRELDAELTEKAAPGPFEDEAQPLLYSIGTVAGPFQASAKRVSTLIEAALSKAGLVCDQYRKELATKLGLFTSPQQHQRCFEFVKSQVHLTEALQLPVNAARVLEGLHCKWIFDKKTLATFEYVRRDSEDDFTITSTVFDVDAQLAGLRNYAAAIVGRYASVPFPSHENQLDEAVLSFMGFYFGGEVRAHDMDIGVYEENLTDAWQEFVVEFLPESGLASDASGNDANVGAADASNKSWDESALGKFILSPSIELAAKCEFLADIPDPVSLAQTFAREYARRTLSSG
jgi:hypothetical protein